MAAGFIRMSKPERKTMAEISLLIQSQGWHPITSAVRNEAGSPSSLPQEKDSYIQESPDQRSLGKLRGGTRREVAHHS